MRKLSELNAGKQAPAIELTIGQSLVLFDGVLDSEKLLRSDEIQSLVKATMGIYNLSYESPKNKEGFQDWLRDEWCRNLNNSMVYPVKAKFEELAQHGHSEEYSGPLNVFVFRPEDAECCYLVLTCNWLSPDGLFRNDNAVIGIIIDKDDLKQVIQDKIK